MTFVVGLMIDELVLYMGNNFSRILLEQLHFIYTKFFNDIFNFIIEHI